jgi:hypothetical protein
MSSIDFGYFECDLMKKIDHKTIIISPNSNRVDL